MSIPAVTNRETHKRALRFLTVGGTAYAVQWLTMKLFIRGLDVNLAFDLSFLCSTATHYTLNRFWALPSLRRDSWRQFIEYLGTVAVSWIINRGMFAICHSLIRLGPLWSTAISVPPSTVVVFLLLNFRVFHAKHGHSE